MCVLILLYVCLNTTGSGRVDIYCCYTTAAILQLLYYCCYTTAAILLLLVQHMCVLILC